MEMKYGSGPTRWGDMLIIYSSTGLTALGFLGEMDEREALADLARNFNAKTKFTRDPAATKKWLRQIDAWSPSGQIPPVDLVGTEFQKKVWNALLKIRPGSTTTYSDIASRVGKPRAARAVGSAIGFNPVSLLVPCHRVVRRDGGLGGYRWGLDAKERLLQMENAMADHKPLS